MYFAPEEHNPPHFHAIYQGQKATVNINICEIMESELSRKLNKLILAWAEMHQDELLANWDLALNGENPYSIDPLK